MSVNGSLVEFISFPIEILGTKLQPTVALTKKAAAEEIVWNLESGVV